MGRKLPQGACAQHPTILFLSFSLKRRSPAARSPLIPAHAHHPTWSPQCPLLFGVHGCTCSLVVGRSEALEKLQSRGWGYFCLFTPSHWLPLKPVG